MKMFNLMVIGGLFSTLCAWTLASQAPRIEADIHIKTAGAAEIVETLDVVVNGRDVRLQGRIRTPVPLDQIRDEVAAMVRSIGAIDGVRHVDAHIELFGTGPITGDAVMLMLSGTAEPAKGES